ncbi:MAG TPA: hypothetical protein PKC19_04635 [Roseiflexaceae bacterium]|nr:hypothetical protein [Roseiflexaceae bacterium]
MQRNGVVSLVIGIVRRVIGVILLIIGLLGLLLPILPGWFFIIPAIVLLGRRDPMLRRLHLVVRWFLRQMRRGRHPQLRNFGIRLCSEYVRARRVIVPALAATERALARVLIW